MNSARNKILGDAPFPAEDQSLQESSLSERAEVPSPESLENPLPILSSITSPDVLREFPLSRLEELAKEIRTVLCSLSARRSVHFASNLGVVELAIALHSTLDFSKDRLIWDTGHQCYPHKLLTGRYPDFESIRTLGGLMGYPNPEESDYDLFMTGHAGTSVGSALGLACGDDLIRPEDHRHSFAVIGDGALASGTVFEALNHAGGLREDITVILNDNKMSICNRVGGLGRYLDHLRLNPTYRRVNNKVRRAIDAIPGIGSWTAELISQLKDRIKAGILGGVLFEEFGFRYIGPIDGHDIKLLKRYLRMVREMREPILLHVLTEKGHGFRRAELDPTSYHAPNPALVVPDPDSERIPKGGRKKGSLKKELWRNESKQEGDISRQDGSATSPDGPILSQDDEWDLVGEHSYTHWVRNAVLKRMTEDERVCVITAAMAQGTMLEPIRAKFPKRFYDVGICEAHAVVLASGLAKAGMRPIVDIYSTFLQRAYDHLFQEVSLQNLPVLLLIDRAGLVGADGPTHHGVFDLAYLRPFPNFRVLSPGDCHDVEPMIRFALAQNGPCAIRYPKTIASNLIRPAAPIEEGRAEPLRSGRDGVLAVLGDSVKVALEVADYFASLPEGERLDLGVVNARFAKPIDGETILAPLSDGRFLITVEEGVLAGGFGSAVLEEAARNHLDTRLLFRVGIPDRYIQHGSRSELLAEIGLDKAGLIRVVLDARRLQTSH